jgi:hypothetical protein
MLKINTLPTKTVIDKSSANTEGIKAVNKMLKGLGYPIPFEVLLLTSASTPPCCCVGSLGAFAFCHPSASIFPILQQRSWKCSA